ncbi:unnamed protein product [Ilex paraguariensis]|uniref:Transmembrane protein n=1 Tax=Ilex paraguariensis TaxID=185542 RepID=A0ABC8QTQ1_9AQUA
MEDPDDEWEYTSPESEVVLPPLLVISTLGFAFSVPFGVVFATYACTEDVCFGKVVTEDEEKEKTEDAKKQLEMRVDCSRRSD